ncbi:IclR family transcriptional regulator [Spirillospora sp. NPDC049024]|uniref:IclR family transcriptional regulator n=1 Tax=unclassified Actinomadura TaxID=2626254 RepID=UPI001F2A602E|nr:IclR family transcriptional regulator [Actinomadura sp. K4S16]
MALPPHTTPSRDPAPSTGLRRDLEILDLLAQPEHAARGLGVSRIARLLDREKSQVSRALKVMEAEALVDRDPDSLEFRLGWRLYSLAARTTEARLTRTAGPYLRRLVAGLNETTHLCVLRGSAVLTLLSVSPSHAFRGLGWEGVTVPVLMTSAGRVLVSDWAPDTLRSWAASWLDEPGHAQARLRIQAADDLLREVAAIRRRGYASVDEEFEAGLVGVSAPVRDFRGTIVAAINVSAPKARLGPHLDEAGRRTLAVARELSAELGHEHAPGVV